MISGLPTKLTAEWFEPREYDIANSVATSARVFGTMMSGILAPLIAKEPADLSYLHVNFSIPIFLGFTGSLFIRHDGYNSKVREQSIKEQVDE